MRTAYLQRPPRMNRVGSALLGLLIVIAIALLVYGVQWCLKKTDKDPDTCNNLTAWKEWRLRESIQKPQQQLSDEQPSITKVIQFDGNAKLQGSREPRGEIRFAVDREGGVQGSWYGNYYNELKVNFDIMGGDFKGKTYPSKIYRDEYGEDRSKLYFITKGTFLINETDFKKSSVHHRSGDIYVRGWIDDDYIATGEITITSNEKYFETFIWKARPVN